MIVSKRLIGILFKREEKLQVEQVHAGRHVVHSKTWSDSLVGADNIGTCEVVVDKTHEVDAAQSRRWREQLTEGT